MKYSILVHYTIPDAPNRCASTLWIDDAEHVPDAYSQAGILMQDMDAKNISLSACLMGHHVMAGEVIIEKEKKKGKK